MTETRDAQRIEAEIANAGTGTDPFAAAVRATRMPMVITNPRLPDNPIVFCNNSFCRLTGYARADIIGRNCRFLQGEGSDPATVAKLRVAIAEHRSVEVDLRNYRKNGDPFWNRLLVAPVFNENGDLAYFFASQVDVTIERERLASLEIDNASLTVEVADRLAAQRESETRLRVATEFAGLGVWEIELATLKLTATPTLNAVYGLPAGMTPNYDQVRAMAHPDDLARVTAAFARASTGDGKYHVSYRVARVDGSIGWVEVRGQVVRADDGRPVRILGVSTDITARKRAEAELELSEESLRLATEAAGVGTWDLDLPTDTLTWSDRTKAMFGISPDVPCSMTDFYEGLHPEDRDTVAAAFAGAIDPARRLAYDVEYRTIGKEDGVVRWVAAKGVAIFADGQCLRALGTAIDITVRRRATERQAVLLHLIDQFRTLSDPRAIMRAAMVGLGPALGANRVGYGQVQDDEATILLDTDYLNDAAPLDGLHRLDDFGPDLIARNRAGLLVVCADTEHDPTIAQETWRTIGTRSFVSVPLIRDGRFRASLFVMRNAASIWDPDDVRLIEDVAARTWDAVERARAEAELHDSEARLRAVIAAAPIGLVFGSAPDGRITGGNAQAERILRHPIYLSAGVEAYREWVSFHPDGRQVEGPEYPLARALAGEDRPELEVLYQRGDGTDAYVHFIGAPVRGAAGEIVGGVVASLDVDRERRAEAALIQLNATLEQRIEERTAELMATEQALQQAQKMDAIGQLTGGVAHDFNNLLTVIRSAADFLRRTDLPEEKRRRYVDAISDTADRGAKLTGQLLAFARRQPLKPEMFDVGEKVVGVAEMIRSLLGGRVRLDVESPGAPLHTEADVAQFETALINLAVNARDAMDGQGELVLRVEEAATIPPTRQHGVRVGPYVAVTVQDTGTGISEENLARIFEPFFTTKSVGKGTGLGLSQVFGFAKQSGGDVLVTSEIGAGTAFTVYLRLVEAVEPLPTPPKRPEATTPVVDASVLVVEDNPEVGEFATGLLQDLGYRTTWASDGEAALDLLGRVDLAFDVVFTDVIMPGMSGIELGQEIRRRYPGLPVVLTSGYSHVLAEQGRHGFDLLQKPYSVEAMARVLRTAVRERGASETESSSRERLCDKVDRQPLPLAGLRP